MYTNSREDCYAATAAAGEALSRQFAQALVAQLRRTARGFGFAPTWRPVYLHFCVQFLRRRHAARQLAAVFPLPPPTAFFAVLPHRRTPSLSWVSLHRGLPCLSTPKPCLDSQRHQSNRDLWATSIMQELQFCTCCCPPMKRHPASWMYFREESLKPVTILRLQHSLHSRSHSMATSGMVLGLRQLVCGAARPEAPRQSASAPACGRLCSAFSGSPLQRTGFSGQPLRHSSWQLQQRGSRRQVTMMAAKGEAVLALLAVLSASDRSAAAYNRAMCSCAECNDHTPPYGSSISKPRWPHVAALQRHLRPTTSMQDCCAARLSIAV